LRDETLLLLGVPVGFNIVQMQFGPQTKTKSLHNAYYQPYAAKNVFHYDNKSFSHHLDYYGPNMVGFGFNLL